MKRVAIPVVKGNLSEYFGQCNHYKIFEINDHSVKSEEIEVPSTKDLINLPEWASKKGITDIITYKVDKNIIYLFSKHKINLFVGVKIDNPNTIIENYINGELKSDINIIKEITK